MASPAQPHPEPIPAFERDHVSVYDAKTHFSQLLDRVTAGETIVITRNGKPVARLTQLEREPARRQPGAMKGQIWVSPDFDEFTEQDERDWFGEPGAVLAPAVRRASRD